MARILICDDTLFMRFILKKMLEDAGYDIVGEATNGLETIEKYKELRPDLVTLDITMPEMNGISALQEIKKINKDAKVIMVSAMGQESMLKDAISKGASDFIVKPFKEGRVLHSIKNILQDKPIGDILR